MKIIFQQEKPSDECFVSNVTAKVKQGGNTAVITWEWPDSKEFMYCFIYDVSQEYYEEYSLDELTKVYQPDIIDRRTPVGHQVELKREGIRCVLFPAKYDALQEAYVLLKQEKDNISEILKQRPVVKIVTKYEDISRGFLGMGSVQEQRVSIGLTGSEPLPGSKLVYRCKGRGRNQIRFGIDLTEFWRKPIEIVIQKGEKLEFEEPTDSSYQLEYSDIKK